MVKNLGDKLVAGGPFGDNSGGLVIIEANDLTDIEEVIHHDPAIAENKLVAKIHPWVTVSGIFNK
ncbi:hypothetical protein LCM10_03920 [Rossellomorea aquimaris]|uniref:YciI family protein n=1 Tax=Rossellomorea aquimaris TaxID=189382 RepID=UPI001CD7DA2A|nr:hypothetical protein [Rossellomorea aquimaris]MCA1054123.1 hypothetical protein [Rossellomorea aquimaris]